MASIEVVASVTWSQLLEAVSRYTETGPISTLCVDDAHVLIAAANAIRCRLEMAEPNFRIPVFKYPPDLWSAAMSASFALEGVKDQTSINMMAADSLLTKPALYKSHRDELLVRLKPEEINLLDGFVLGSGSGSIP